MEGGWRPMREAATDAEAALAETIRRLLPRVAPLLWNVRGDLPPFEMGEVMAERMRLLGAAGLWIEIGTLERHLDAVRAGVPGC
jgi:hypothetical protein